MQYFTYNFGELTWTRLVEPLETPAVQLSGERLVLLALVVVRDDLVDEPVLVKHLPSTSVRL